MITGSHNPPDYNGFKMMLGKGRSTATAIKELGEIAAGAYADGDGTTDEGRHVPAYIDRLPRTITAPGHCGGLGRRQRRGRPGHGRWRPTCPAATCLFAEDRRQLPQPPSRPDRAAKSGRPDQQRDRGRLRARHRLRRRRRPDRRRRWRGPDRLRRPDPADPGGRRAGPPSRRPPSSPTSRPARASSTRWQARRRAVDVEDRPLPDQGQDGRGGLAAGRRDVRAHLLQGRLLRPRRRALRGGPAARHPGRRQPITMAGSRSHARRLQHARDPLRLPARSASSPAIGEVRAHLAAEGADVDSIDGVRVKNRTAGGWPAPPTPRPCSWSAPRPARPRAWNGSRPPSATSWAGSASRRRPDSEPAVGQARLLPVALDWSGSASMAATSPTAPPTRVSQARAASTTGECRPPTARVTTSVKANAPQAMS